MSRRNSSVREEVPAHSSQSCESTDVLGTQFSEEGRIKLIAPILLLQRQIAETNIEITLNRTQIYAELVRKRLWIEPFPLIQLNQHLRQLDQRVVGSCHAGKFHFLGEDNRNADENDQQM